MRYVFGFLCVCALGAMPMVGCTDDGGTGGRGSAAGGGGVGGDGGTMGQVFPCTEQGILAAVAAGGGPYKFDCDGPTTVVTTEEIVIDKDVVLDGDGNLAVDGRVRSDQPVLSVSKGVKAALHRLATRGGAVGFANQGTLTLRDCVIAGHQSEFLFGAGAGIRNEGEMAIIDSTVTRNFAGHGVGGGIYNRGEMTIINSTVSDNSADGDGNGLYGGGILNSGDMTIINSTVSGNDAEDTVGPGAIGGGIANAGSMSVTNSTVWGNTPDAIAAGLSSSTEIANTLVDGDCVTEAGATTTSNGYNIESPGDTCGFDQETDQTGKTAGELNLGPLQDNGGPTITHALLTEPTASVAIDVIPEEDCVDADGASLLTDQRGELRPVAILGPAPKCDVGAFEVQP